MSRLTPTRLPKYRHQKSRNLAVVRINGRDHYLGRYNSPESHAEYRRLVGEYFATGMTPQPAVTQDEAGALINDLMIGYIRHVDAYYVKNGKPTSEVRLIRDALRVLRHLYGHTPARDFGPLALKTVRKAYIDAGLCLNEVNRRTRLVVRFFRWATENELVPPSVHHGLKTVAGLRKGRTDIRETEPVKAVPEDHVDAVLPHLGRRVAAMIQLQRLTGMRPGEVTIMRTCDLERSGAVWIFTPENHKNEHRGKRRQIALGPKAQAILKPWLKADPYSYLFSPREEMAEIWVERRRKRKTPVQPSQRARANKKPKRTPGIRWTKDSYGLAIRRACVKAGIPHWHPNQLRHLAATRINRECGLDEARVVLGHTKADTTTIYIERDAALAASVMERIG
jgi:integrase